MDNTAVIYGMHANFHAINHQNILLYTSRTSIETNEYRAFSLVFGITSWENGNVPTAKKYLRVAHLCIPYFMPPRMKNCMHGVM